MQTQLRALTLHPEWAWAICHLDKRVENRPERIAKMVLNVIGDGWLAIHAGAHIGGRPSRAAAMYGVFVMWCAARTIGKVGRYVTEPGPEYQGTFRVWRHDGSIIDAPVQRSAIVALARVGPGNPDSLWAVKGQVQIGLRDIFVLPEPVPCSGKQGLWTVPDDVAVKVYAQLPKQEKP